MSEPVGTRVRKLREARDWSQIELGRRAGLSNQIISRIEGDRVEPKLSSLDRIAAAFGVTTAELLSEPEPARKVAG